MPRTSSAAISTACPASMSACNARVLILAIVRRPRTFGTFLYVSSSRIQRRASIHFSWKGVSLASSSMMFRRSVLIFLM